MLNHISFTLLSTPLPPSRDNDQVNENVSIGLVAKIGMSLQSHQCIGEISFLFSVMEIYI